MTPETIAPKAPRKRKAAEPQAEAKAAAKAEFEAAEAAAKAQAEADTAATTAKPWAAPTIRFPPRRARPRLWPPESAPAKRISTPPP